MKFKGLFGFHFFPFYFHVFKFDYKNIILLGFSFLILKFCTSLFSTELQNMKQSEKCGTFVIRTENRKQIVIVL